MKSAHSKSPQYFKGKKVKKTNKHKQSNKRMGRKDGAKKKKRRYGKKNPVGLRTHKIELLVPYKRYKVENTSE